MNSIENEDQIMAATSSLADAVVAQFVRQGITPTQEQINSAVTMVTSRLTSQVQQRLLSTPSMSFKAEDDEDVAMKGRDSDFSPENGSPTNSVHDKAQPDPAFVVEDGSLRTQAAVELEQTVVRGLNSICRSVGQQALTGLTSSIAVNPNRDMKEVFGQLYLLLVVNCTSAIEQLRCHVLQTLRQNNATDTSQKHMMGRVSKLLEPTIRRALRHVCDSLLQLNYPREYVEQLAADVLRRLAETKSVQHHQRVGFDSTSELSQDRCRHRAGTATHQSQMYDDVDRSYAPMCNADEGVVPGARC